jgi:uncharacterized coiled-coil protein SlyX
MKHPLQSRVEPWEFRVAQLENRITELEHQIEMLNTHISTARDTIHELCNQVGDLQNAPENSLRDRVAKLELKLKEPFDNWPNWEQQ